MSTAASPTTPHPPSPPPTNVAPSPDITIPLALPRPQSTFGTLSLTAPQLTSDFFHSHPPPSPVLTYFTAPSSPLTENVLHPSPPSPPPHPHSSNPWSNPQPSTDDYFPTVSTSTHIAEPPLFAGDLTSLEKIYLFSRSSAYFHRVFISHAIPAYLQDGLVSPAEAVAYVLPLLRELALDDDKSVAEAFASELVPVIWYFFTHCQLVSDDLHNVPSHDPQWGQDPSLQIPVNTFTPILGTLLLSPDAIVSKAARYAVVDVLARIRDADRLGDDDNRAQSSDGPPLTMGTFSSQARRSVEREILQHVVIGIGRLDEGEELHGELQEAETTDHAHQEQPTVSIPPLAVSPTSTYSSTGHPPPTMAQAHEARGHTRDIGGDDEEYANTEAGEQAAVGRLSCMSLVAAVAASSGGHLADDTQSAFVSEVERVGRDPIYWVRREASFAVGALAKVVPVEVLLVSLLPLFEALGRDSVWHVRHSALFALPAIVARLTPPQRRSLALSTIPRLSTDESPPVRSGVLEVLGEVLYTFREDEDGPPPQLLRLFLGRREDERVRNGQQALEKESEKEAEAKRKKEESWRILFGAIPEPPPPIPAEPETPLESFFNDPARPLICAFNYPAVVLTLGRGKWEGDVREAYLQLAENRAVKVRRTLAASLGEIAKMIGEEYARRDLVGIWKDAISCEEEEVRMRAIECVEAFVEALGESQWAARVDVVAGLRDAWQRAGLKGWREREAVAKALVGLGKLMGRHSPTLIRDLLMKALEDAVAYVREAAVSVLPQTWKQARGWHPVATALRADVDQLSTSPIHRRRMTFIACQQELLLSGDEDALACMKHDEYWDRFFSLSKDSILDVRIALARLIGTVFDKFYRDSQPTSGTLRDLVHQLSQDRAGEVRAYLPTSGRTMHTSMARVPGLFSRPPPT